MPKRIQMDLLRGFSREKLVNSFLEVIEKNYESTAAFTTMFRRMMGAPPRTYLKRPPAP